MVAITSIFYQTYKPLLHSLTILFDKKEQTVFKNLVCPFSLLELSKSIQDISNNKPLQFEGLK